MDNPEFGQLFNDSRFSLATVLAVWMSLAKPIVLISIGVVAIGGSFTEVGAVLFAAALFSAADILGLLLRVHDATEEEKFDASKIMDLPVPAMAKVLETRFL
ncbi:hypothetical protein [Parvularcula maris]|uniref:Uncharacterized protein n=1 Tax=Parvularcula maris TaxID=2965077 RepID=A0A9X2LBA6_9PROT|nr:hypothetical protein [Parvularcula maris]MCQ8186401.1 hypothetical protein [Parvularcula maris]